MGEWKVIAHSELAMGLVDRILEGATTGVEQVAAKASEIMLEASHRAFAEKRDPRSGERWAEPSDETLATGDFRDLLHRTGRLEAAVRSGYKLVPAGARAFINVESEPHGRLSTVGLAMVHMYGVEAKRSRSYVVGTGRYAGRTRTRRRKRPGQVMPARRFIGLSTGEVRELIELAEARLTGGEA